jgi:hypothetical protein
MKTDPENEDVEALPDVEEGSEVNENAPEDPELAAEKHQDQPQGDVPTWDQPESGTRKK